MAKLKSSSSAAKPVSTPKPLKVGSTVAFIEDDTEMQGLIKEIRKKTYIIEDDKGDLYEQPHGDVKPVEEEEPAKPTPSKSKLIKKPATNKGTSLLGLLQAAEAAPDGGGSTFPQGNWDALVTGARTEEDKTGQRIGIIEYTGVTQEEVEGKMIPSRSIIMTADGGEGPGLGYFKRDLLKLGVDVDSYTDEAELDAALEELGTVTQPWVDIRTAPQKSNPQFMNVYLDGVKENQEDKPELPAY